MNKQFFSDRPRLLTWISVLFALILAARLFSLQIIHGEDYSQSFEESVTRKIRIPAQRGRILDRNGTVLAESVPVRDITIVDKTGNSREENARLNTIIQNTLEILSRKVQEGVEVRVVFDVINNSFNDTIQKDQSLLINLINFYYNTIFGDCHYLFETKFNFLINNNDTIDPSHFSRRWFIDCA